MNELQYEKSPYLLQHKENPVYWMPWSSRAFKQAENEEKPIFLSIGYSTCHWCHVMAHESFENETIAEKLNKYFVCVKVDREERPDVDRVYMEACVAANGSGGWPLTVLMTPDQKPFWVGTYLKRNELYQLLDAAAQLWRNDREKLLHQGDAFAKHLQNTKENLPGTPRKALLQKAAESLNRRCDKTWGGFGFGNKFPMAHNLLFLMRYSQLTGVEEGWKNTELALEHMSRGGIFDQIGGGFSRYSTDVKWLAPHFEKMLYDNALLLLAYTEAYQLTGREWYRHIVEQTANYVLRELQIPQGGFCCGQDADSDGEEGKFYLFRQEEIGTVLGAEALEFCKRFDVTPGGNFHGKNILNLIRCEDWESIPLREEAQRKKLLDYRLMRTKLHRDDKVLTAWNGLMIGALAKASLVFEAPALLDASKQAAAFVEAHLRDRNGTLLARWCDGSADFIAKLEDVVFYAWGRLQLYEVTNDTQDLAIAVQLGDTVLKSFFDHEKGGCYPYSENSERLLTRKKDAEDGALPSGNGMAALVLSRLARLTGEQRFTAAADLQLRWLAGAVEAYPASACVTMLAMLESLWPTEELVVCSREFDSAELRDYLRHKPRIGLTVLVKTPESEAALEKLAPFTASYPLPECGTQYYRCHGGTCERPTGTLVES